MFALQMITNYILYEKYFIFLSETHTGKALLCVYILLVRSILTSKRRRNSYLRSSSLHYIEYVFTEGSYSYYTAHCSPQSFPQLCTMEHLFIFFIAFALMDEMCFTFGIHDIGILLYFTKAGKRS